MGVMEFIESGQIAGGIIPQSNKRSPVSNTLLLDAPLQAGFTLAKGSGTYTAARASTDIFVDYEGIVRTALSGQGCFRGSRTVRNEVASSSEDITDAAWVAAGSATKDDADTITFTSGSTDQVSQSSPIAGGTASIDSIVSAVLWTDSGTRTVRLKSGHSGVADHLSPDITITTTPTRYSFAQTYGSSAGNGNGSVGVVQGTTPAAGAFHFTNAQYENATGRSDTTTPSEYVSVGVGDDHGSNVDGVKSFTTTNGNTVTDNVVTEGVGAGIGASDYYADADGPHGYQSQAAGTNQSLYSSDLSDANHTLTNVTVNADAGVGPIDGELADDIVDDATNGLHSLRIAGGAILTVSNTWCQSIYV